MPHLYKLKCVLSLLLFLPLGLVAQQTKSPELQKQLAQKLAPHLHHLRYSNGPASYRIRIQNRQALDAWLQQQQLHLQVRPVRGQENVLLVSGISPQQLQQLLTSPAVLYVDKPNRVAREELELKDADFVANNIYAAQGLFPQLRGEGMAVSVKENAFNPDDLDLKGRVLTPESIGSARSVHATTMATIIAGAGNSGPNGKGVTTQSKIAYSDFAELYPDDSQLLLKQGVSVQNHSYGVGVENYYGLEAQAYDQQAYRQPQLLHVFSSGNSGDQAETTGTYANLSGIANLTGQFKMSKNTLSVGALEPNGEVGLRSSRGPAYDGRVKPELVAHGKGGTSEAAAVVSGIALLVQQAYREKHGTLPPAALVKAALINSADDAGRPGVDFESGFGNADALGAIRSITEERFLLGTVKQSEEKTFRLSIPAGVHLLKATLVWHDPEAEPNAERALIHDLDLTLHNEATGYTWKPWVLSTYPHPDSLRLPARRGADRLNNVEQVTLSLPAAGSYTLRIKGHRVPQGPQQFSLVYAYERGTEWLYPTTGATLLPGQPNRITWQGPLQAATGQLDYRLSGSKVWHPITDRLDLTRTDFEWQAPDTVAMAQLRLTIGGMETVSEEFMLAPPLQLQVGLHCEEQTILHWPQLPNVQQYQVYYLGATHLEPLQIVSDTLVILDNSKFRGQNNYVAVAPILQGQTAPTSRAIPIDSSAASGCYILSFLPRKLVTDTVELDLELSTLHQLASISLERLQKGAFKTISTLSPVLQLSHRLTDPQPGIGRNVYRVKVSTTDGRAFYSQEEHVIYASGGYLQVYPNPVAAGQPFFVAVNEEEVQVQLYDQLGRLVRETREIGALKEVQTTGLTKGLYILRLQTAKGTVATGKVRVF